MKISLKNSELSLAVNFLSAMEISNNKDSRCRSKLVSLLIEAAEGLSKEEQQLLEECSLLDDMGMMLPEEKRSQKDVAKFNREQRELYNETVEITGGMYTRNIEQVPEILRNYEGKLSGNDAYIYDRLLDEFEKNEEDNE